MSEKSTIKRPKKEDLIDIVKGRGFDSIEEFEFNEWLGEAFDLGIVEVLKHHPEPLKLSERFSVMVEKQLKTKVATVEKFLLHPHEYTPDFRVVFNNASLTRIGINTYDLIASADPLNNDPGRSVHFIDVKGGFSRFHDAKSFSINQKWVYAKYKIFINKIVPEEWFAKTWVPEFCKTTWKTGKIRDKYRGYLDKAIIREKLK